MAQHAQVRARAVYLVYPPKTSPLSASLRFGFNPRTLDVSVYFQTDQNPDGGCHVTAKRLTPVQTLVLDHWRQTLTERTVPFVEIPSVLPPDPSTLFVTSGMQKHKPKFTDPSWRGETMGDVQRCLRLNDLDEVDDGRHGLVFHMLGLFSFQHWTVPQGLSLIHDFFRRCGVPLTHVTVHPDKMDEWSPWHEPYGLPVLSDPECQWSDGQMGGYCTEFYVGELEVGNLVNPLGHSLDIGLGLERISQLLGDPPLSGLDQLRLTLGCLEDEGLSPGPKQQGYVTRRLVREWLRRDSQGHHPWLDQERHRQERQTHTYQRWHPKVGDQTPQWWWETHGVRVEDFLSS